MSTVSTQLRLTIAAGAIAAVITGAFLVSCAPAKQATIANQPTSVQLSQAEFLAGMTPVQGPGIIVTLHDSTKPLPNGLPPGMTPPNLIHDTDINQVVDELKAGGAEAIAVNDQRLVAITPIRCAGPTIFVNFIPQTPPFTIKAIGSPKTLAATLNIPGGIASQIKRFDASMLSVEETQSLRLPAFSERSVPYYAKPVSLIEAPFTDSEISKGMQNESSTTSTAGKTRTMIGYGLDLLLSGKRYCRAREKSLSANAGIPVDGFIEIIEVNRRPSSVPATQLLAMFQSPPPLRLRLKEQNGHTRTVTFVTKAGFSVPSDAAIAEDRAEDIASKKADLSTANQALANTKQQLESKLHEALPQDDARALRAAFLVEQRFGDATGQVQFASEYQAWCRKKNNSESFIQATQSLLRAQTEMRQALTEEASDFPTASQSRRLLPELHLLAIQLSNKQFAVSMKQGLVNVSVSLIQEKPLPTV